MVNYLDSFEDDEDDEITTPEPQDDSALLKQLRKANRIQERELKAFKEAAAITAKEKSEATVAEVLKQKGVSPKAARLILRELDEVNTGTVEAWLKDNAEVFTFTQNAGQETVDPNLVALAAQDGFIVQAGTPGSGNAFMDALDNPILTQEQFDALIASQQ